MQLNALRMELIQPGSDLVAIILNAINGQNLTLENYDILAIASKAVATAENRLKKLASVKPSSRAKRIAAKFSMEPRFVEVVLHEADAVYWGVPKALLTLKGDVLIPNAGVDQKNAPEGYVVLWPRNPFKAAEKIRRDMYERTGKHVGVLIVDSRVTPLRMGTTGIAIGLAGFEPVTDYRAKRDLYGRRILITTHSVADDLGSAAHLIMGESSEQTAAVLIRNAPVKITEKIDVSDVAMPREQCLFASHIKPELI
jgi:coenzyme F420-0:L-glutamate ligase/coenzyme F420-1:gamma-L-glutamate ligase